MFENARSSAVGSAVASSGWCRWNPASIRAEYTSIRSELPGRVLVGSGGSGGVAFGLAAAFLGGLTLPNCPLFSRATSARRAGASCSFRPRSGLAEHSKHSPARNRVLPAPHIGQRAGRAVWWTLNRIVPVALAFTSHRLSPVSGW